MKHENIKDDTAGNLTGAARWRHEKRQAAIWALENLDPQDAATICATVLDEIGAGFPRLDWWGDAREEAAEWAYGANSGELEAYFTSALKRLNNQALGLKARKRMIAALFQSLSATDQAAFLEWARGAA